MGLLDLRDVTARQRSAFLCMEASKLDGRSTGACGITVVTANTANHRPATLLTSRNPACIPSRPKETIHNWMDVLCLFSGICFQAELEKEVRLKNNGATGDDLAINVKQRAHPDIVETIPRHIAEVGISMLGNFQRLVVVNWLSV